MFGEVASTYREAPLDWQFMPTFGASTRLRAVHAKVSGSFHVTPREVSRPIRKQSSRRGATEVNNAVLGGFQDLVPAYRNRLDGMLAISKTCDIMPCLDGMHMVRFVDPSTRPRYVHVCRTATWSSVSARARCGKTPGYPVSTLEHSCSPQDARD